MFAASYLRLHGGAEQRVDDFVEYLKWRCERGNPLGQRLKGNLYVAVMPSLEDGTKIRILYGDDKAKLRIDLHSLSFTSASAATAR